MAKSATVRVYMVLLLIGVAILLMVCRTPAHFTGGRVWAEDSRHLQYALESGPAKGLGFVYGPEGYFTFQANLVCAIATLLPYEWIGQWFVLAGLFYLFVPTLVALLDMRLRREPITLALPFLVLLINPAQEIWLTPVDSQFAIAVAIAVVLIAKPTDVLTNLVYLGAVVFGGLSGIASLLLGPAFFLQAIRERRGWRFAQFAALLLCFAAQVMVIRSHPGSTPRERIAPPLHVAAAIMAKQVDVVFLGQERPSDDISPSARLLRVRDSILSNHIRPAGKIVLFSLPALLYGGVVVIAARARRWDAVILLSGAATSAAVGLLGGLSDPINHVSPYAMGRYFYTPNVLVVMALLFASTGRSPLPTTWRRVGGLLVVWTLVIGLLQFYWPQNWYFVAPTWRDQIANWRKHPNANIMVSPPPWAMRLPAPSASMPPPPSRPAETTKPRPLPPVTVPSN